LPDETRRLVDAGILLLPGSSSSPFGASSLLYRMQNNVAWTLFIWILLLTQLLALQRLYKTFPRLG
jgi:hypothetical protein